MFSCFLAVLLLTLTAFSLSLLLKKSFTDLLAPVVFGVIYILFGFYAADQLFLGRNVVILLMLLTIGYGFFRTRPSLSTCKSLVFDRSFLLYAAGIALFALFSWNKFVSLYDSLRLWGAYPKVLHATGMIQLGEQSMLYPVMQSYPPGMPMLCYFFTSFSPVFPENALFFTYSFFGFTLMLSFLSDSSQKKSHSSFLIFLGILFVPYLVTGMNDDAGYYYSSLFIDIPLGICCGYFFSRAFHPRSRLDLVCAVLSCGILVLLKDSGAFLALCGIAGGLLCNLLPPVNGKKRHLLVAVLLELLVLAYTYGLWKYLLNIYGVVRKIQPAFTIPSLRTLGLLFLHFIKTPVTGILTVTGAVHISLPAALITIFAAKLLLAKYDPNYAASKKIADISVQFICYAGFFLGYCFSFIDQIENLVYPSFARYHCTLLICAIYSLAYDCHCHHNAYLRSLFQDIHTMAKNCSFSGLISSATSILRLGTILCLVFSTLLIVFYCPSKSEDFYGKAKGSADALSVCIHENATVYLCMPDDSPENTLIQHRLYFELLDDGIYIPNYLTSVDITESGMGYTCDTFMTHLTENGYDYILLTGVSDSLAEEFRLLFGDIFPEETNLIYQVDSGNGQLIRIR